MQRIATFLVHHPIIPFHEVLWDFVDFYIVYHSLPSDPSQIPPYGPLWVFHQQIFYNRIRPPNDGWSPAKVAGREDKQRAEPANTAQQMAGGAVTNPPWCTTKVISSKGMRVAYRALDSCFSTLDSAQRPWTRISSCFRTKDSVKVLKWPKLVFLNVLKLNCCSYFHYVTIHINISKNRFERDPLATVFLWVSPPPPSFSCSGEVTARSV